MLRTLPQIGENTLRRRLLGVGIMTALTILAARISIPMDPVPFTMQPLAALLAGMILGPRDGALSQLFYVALIAIGLPVDANMLGNAALFGPTGGYLIGFIAGAFVTGWITEQGANRVWMRWLAGVAGILTIYAFGLPVLMLSRGMDFATAWSRAGAAFLIPDLAKAAIAAALTEGGRALLKRG